jgi:hypothetical protein
MKEFTQGMLHRAYKSGTRYALVLILFSTSIRIYYAVTRDLYPSGPDGPWFIQIMSDFAEFGFFSNRVRHLPFYPSGYPAILSIFPRISDDYWIPAAQIFQITILGFALFLWFLLIKQYFDTGVALISIIVITLSTSWLVFPGEAMYESLLISFIIFYFYSFNKLLFTGNLTLIKILLSGLLAGLIFAVHPRALMLVILPMLFIYKFVFKNKFIWYWLGAFSFFPLLFAARNYFAESRFTLWSSSFTSFNYGHQVALNGSSILEILWKILTNPIAFIHDTFINILYFFSPFSGPLARGTWFHNISASALLARNGHSDLALGISVFSCIVFFIVLALSLKHLASHKSRIMKFLFSGFAIVLLTDALIYGDNRHRLIANIFLVPIYSLYLSNRFIDKYYRTDSTSE